MRFTCNVWAAAILIAARAGASASRPFFEVPTLVQVRDILAQLEAPIVSTIVQRATLPVTPSWYTTSKSGALMTFLAAQETRAQASGRYDYGAGEYPFVLPGPAPDLATSKNPFPAGRFHLDSFSGNANISTFYQTIFIPSLTPSLGNPYFFHLSNGSSHPGATDMDATLAVDATLLKLLSNRAHIGKLVAEAKFLGSTAQYSQLIKAKNAGAIRTLLTNTTQEDQVFLQADTAAKALATAWVEAGASVSPSFVSTIQTVTRKVFQELIQITTEIEVQYLLARL